ncbi:MAG TPA: phosphatase PAP2 family protein [Candidatus Saccharimonadales bacterium]|nr:phosphatase PAP2 family protein [Candidatus Saccharimonadales bacterium]
MTQELLIRILADGSLIPIVLLGAYALIFKVPKGQRLQSYTRILMAGLTAYLLAKMISVVYQPSGERPFEVLGTVAGASFLNNPGFPSDHALFVAAITCAVWFETRQKVITIILIGLTIAVCVGRILALVHTPADVIGGIVIALIGALWYLNDRPRSAK